MKNPIRLALTALLAAAAALLSARREYRRGYRRGQSNPIPTAIRDAHIIGGEILLGTRAMLVGCHIERTDGPVRVLPGAEHAMISGCRIVPVGCTCDTGVNADNSDCPVHNPPSHEDTP